MVELRCVGTCYLPTGKKGILVKYEDITYDSDPEGDIYEFTEKGAEVAMASGNFVPVED